MADLHSGGKSLKGNDPACLISVFHKCHCGLDRAEEEHMMDGHLCLPVVKGEKPMSNLPSVTSTEHVKRSLKC